MEGSVEVSKEQMFKENFFSGNNKKNKEALLPLSVLLLEAKPLWAEGIYLCPLPILAYLPVQGLAVLKSVLSPDQSLCFEQPSPFQPCTGHD